MTFLSLSGGSSSTAGTGAGCCGWDGVPRFTHRIIPETAVRKQQKYRRRPAGPGHRPERPV